MNNVRDGIENATALMLCALWRKVIMDTSAKHDLMVRLDDARIVLDISEWNAVLAMDMNIPAHWR